MCGLLLCFLTLFSLPLQAAPVIELKPQQTYIALDTYVDILDDPEQRYSAADLFLPPLALQFGPTDLSSRARLKHYSKHLWLRFSIHNPGNTALQLWLSANDNSIRQITLYQWQPDTASVQLMADAPVREAKIAPLLKQIDIPAQRTASFVLRVETQSPYSFRLALEQPQHFFINSISQASQFSAGLGLLFGMTVLGYIIALFRRSQIFLYQTNYVSSIFLVQLIGLGLARNWLPEHSAIQHAAIFCLIFIGNGASIHATQHYLKSCGCYTKFRSPIHFALNVNMIGFLILLFMVGTYSPMTWLVIAITGPIQISATYYCYRKTRELIPLLITWTRLIGAIAYVMALFLHFDSFNLQQIINPTMLMLLITEAFSVGVLLLAHEFFLFSKENKNQQMLRLNEARQQAQNLVLSDISHDLRTPISGILGMADLLKASSLSAGQQEQVEAVRNAGQALLNKVTELQQRVQLQQGELADQKAPFELALLLEECVGSFQLQAEERNLELILNIQPDVPVIVEGNAIYLRQILLQLISNAVKYTAQGEVVVQVSRQASQPTFINFMIRDTGRGISKQQLAEMQQKSQRHNLDLSLPFGLPVVQELLRRLKSHLNIHSRLGEGSEFSFILHLPAAHNSEQIPLGDSRILQGRKLLVVDDNHTCCRVLKQQAGSWGMQVTEAYDGSEALAMFRARKNLDDPFDAIIIDYDMPHLSGLEVAERISAETDVPPVIIMLTGLSLAPPEAITRQAGIEVVLNKPASQKLIRLTLSNLLYLHEQGQSSPLLGNHQMRVLIAEDNDVSRRVISKMMERLGVHFKLVSDGQLALDAIKREDFDLILMDCEMPIMNGFDATLSIHEWQQTRHQPLTPVVALTAHVMGEHKARSEAVGMVGYLEKPVQLAELEATINQWRKTTDATE